MARRSIAPVIAELIDAIEGIQAATHGKTVHDFEGDWLLRRGIERGIEIISEATRHLPDDTLATHSTIPWQQIKGIGNILRHEYHKIAPKIIWGVVSSHLEPLKLAILAIRDQEA